MDSLFIISGLILLVLGGNWLLKSAVGLSFRLNISKLIVGLTVVSFATSLPELIVSVQAALDGFPDIGKTKAREGLLGNHLTIVDLQAAQQVGLQVFHILQAHRIAHQPLADAGGLALGNIAAGIDVDLIADADILAGTIRAGRDARLTAGGLISTGAISVGDRLFLRSGGRVDTGAIDAIGSIGVTATGALTATTITSSGSSIDLMAGGALAAGALDAATRITVAGGATSLGALRANADILVAASGALINRIITGGGAVTLGGEF
jgi:hypothetical protein